MYSLTCHEIGDNACGYQVKSDIKRAIIERMMDHLKRIHPDKTEGMIERDMVKNMEEKIAM